MDSASSPTSAAFADAPPGWYTCNLGPKSKPVLLWGPRLEFFHKRYGYLTISTPTT